MHVVTYLIVHCMYIMQTSLILNLLWISYILLSYLSIGIHNLLFDDGGIRMNYIHRWYIIINYMSQQGWQN